MNNLDDYLVFALAFFALWLSARIGSFFHKRRQKLEEDMPEDFGVILTATLTLLGLIIGFSFSMAIGRYEQRKNYEEEEANAIGTEYVRADLLPAADAARVRALLRNYLDQRVLVQFPINGCSCWQNDFLGSMPPRSPSRALERSLLFWLAV
jgi:hypothetical protein